MKVYYVLTDNKGFKTSAILSADSIAALESKLSAEVGDGDGKYLFYFNDNGEQVASSTLEIPDFSEFETTTPKG